MPLHEPLGHPRRFRVADVLGELSAPFGIAELPALGGEVALAGGKCLSQAHHGSLHLHQRVPDGRRLRPTVRRRRGIGEELFQA
jgi:hypothetical protein